MILQVSGPVVDLVGYVIGELGRSIVDSIPRVLSGLLCLGVAYIAI